MYIYVYIYIHLNTELFSACLVQKQIFSDQHFWCHSYENFMVHWYSKDHWLRTTDL